MENYPLDVVRESVLEKCEDLFGLTEEHPAEGDVSYDDWLQQNPRTGFYGYRSSKVRCVWNVPIL